MTVRRGKPPSWEEAKNWSAKKALNLLKEKGQEAYVDDLVKIGLSKEVAIRTALDHLLNAHKTRKAKVMAPGFMLGAYHFGDHSSFVKFMSEQERIHEVQEINKRKAHQKTLAGKQNKAVKLEQKVLNLYKNHGKGVHVETLMKEAKAARSTVYRICKKFGLKLKS